MEPDDPKRRVMAGFASRTLLSKDSKERERARWEKPLGYARSILERMTTRVEASRELLGRHFYRGDCHAHTQHSDGIGTVAESAEMSRAAGLDFQWITDHWGLTQAPECAEHGLWVGQEPATEFHHLGILDLDRTFAPTQSLVEDHGRVLELGGTPYIPHPAGWWPQTVYTREQKDALRSLPSPFLMEIINGAGNLVTAFDYTDAAAVELWDELLCEGRQIHGLGNTDAHSPHQIGMVWNGVFAERCDQESVLHALRSGASFASEAAVLELSVGETNMGSVVPDRSEAGLLRLRVADVLGLLEVRLVADGKVRYRWHPEGEPLFVHEEPLPATALRYVRVEATSADGRRAFSNPVYLTGSP